MHVSKEYVSHLNGKANHPGLNFHIWIIKWHPNPNYDVQHLSPRNMFHIQMAGRIQVSKFKFPDLEQSKPSISENYMTNLHMKGLRWIR